MPTVTPWNRWLFFWHDLFRATFLPTMGLRGLQPPQPHCWHESCTEKIMPKEKPTISRGYGWHELCYSNSCAKNGGGMWRLWRLGKDFFIIVNECSYDIGVIWHQCHSDNYTIDLYYKILCLGDYTIKPHSVEIPCGIDLAVRWQKLMIS